MYYPVVVTAAEYGFALAGRLRPGGAGSGSDAVAVLRPVLARLREALPGTRIVVRADSGFPEGPLLLRSGPAGMDPELYDLCEEFGAGYLIRLRMNEVLKRYFDRAFGPRAEARLRAMPGPRPALYAEDRYAAGSWPRKRRIVMKLQYDPREGEFERYAVVTNLRRSKRGSWRRYERRGLCEQRTDELRNHLRADKFSLSTFEANDLKLQFMLLAYNLHAAARVMLPERHELKRATVGRLMVTLVKCGASVRRTVRRMWLHASRTWPYRELLADVARRFAAGVLRPTPLWDTG
jgi:hypothetical protein